MAERSVPRYLVVVLASVARPNRSPRPLAVRATRAALNDLRFKGDGEVFASGDGASVCVGGHELTRVACTPFDVPALARAFHDLRVGQARRVIARRAAAA